MAMHKKIYDQGEKKEDQAKSSKVWQKVYMHSAAGAPFKAVPINLSKARRQNEGLSKRPRA